MKTFEILLEKVLKDKYRAAVGIVQYKDTWLLGLARSKDDRNGKWVFPGGHTKSNESPERAAEREVYEETGIKCKAYGKAFTFGNKKDVAFVHCKSQKQDKLSPNSEFSALGFFKKSEIKNLKQLYYNVKELIERVN